MESMVPCEFDSYDSVDFAYNLDGTDTNDSVFDLEKYGSQLQPQLTPELEARINENPSTAYQKRSAT